MMRFKKPLSASLAAAALMSTGALLATPASADAVADFYNDKTIKIIVAAGPGGNHSNYSLLLAPF